MEREREKNKGNIERVFKMKGKKPKALKKKKKKY